MAIKNINNFPNKNYISRLNAKDIPEFVESYIKNNEDLFLNGVDPINKSAVLDKIKKDLTDGLTQDSLSDNYIQALANMGQRMGIKGDSISYKSFRFTDCFEDSSVFNYNTSEYVGYIKYNDLDKFDIYEKTCTFGITKRNVNTYIPYVKYPSLINSVEILNNKPFSDIFGKLTLDKNLQFDTLINNIIYYHHRSIIKKDGDRLYTLLFGKLPSDENEEINIEIMYNVFNLKTNMLEYALRLFHHNNYYEPVYCLLELDNMTIYGGTGKFRVYLYDTVNNITDINKIDSIEKFNTYFKEANLNDDTVITDLELNTFFNNLITVNTSEIYTTDTLFGVILSQKSYLNNSTTRIYQVGDDIDVYYSNNESTKFIYDENKLQNYIDNNVFPNDKLGLSIQNRLDFMNNDIIYLYPKLLKSYNNLYYTKDIRLLYRKILLSIFDRLIKNTSYSSELNTITYDGDNGENHIMYIPLNTNIYYYCNTNDEFNIYTTNNLFVNLININDLNSTNYNRNILNSICFLNKNIYAGKTESISINTVYNDTFNDLINDFNVSIDYTLAYIDPKTYDWVLNENSSGICSYINQYDKQYLIIIKSAEDLTNDINSSVILNNIPEDFDINEFQKVRFTINPEKLLGSKMSILLTEEENYVNSLEAFCALPKINNNEYLYENTLIFSIITDKNVPFLAANKYDNSFSFCSLWKYNSTIKEFEIIKDVDGDTPFDLSALLNFSIANQKYNNMQNHIFDYLIMLMFDKKYLNNYSKFSNIFVEYPENINDDEEQNKLVIGRKVIPNDSTLLKRDIANSFLDPVDIKNMKSTIKNNGSDNFYLTFDDNGNIISNEQTNNEKVETKDIFTREFIYEKSTVSATTNTNTQEAGILEDNSTAVSNETIGITSQQTITSEVKKEIADYKFNVNVPVINNAEVLQKNNNFINRINILTLDQKNDNNGIQNIVYNTIIGSDYSKTDNKNNVFVIKPTNENYNLGSETLIREDNRNKFKTQDKILIEFPEIELRGKNNVYFTTYYNECQNIVIRDNNDNDINYNIYIKTLSLFGNAPILLTDENRGNDIIIGNSDANYNKLSNKVTIISETINFEYNKNCVLCMNKIGGTFGYDYVCFNLKKYLIDNNTYNEDEYNELFTYLKNNSDFINGNDVISRNTGNNSANNINYKIQIRCIEEFNNNTVNLILIFINKDYVSHFNINNNDNTLYKANIDIELIKIVNTQSYDTKFMFNVK